MNKKNKQIAWKPVMIELFIRMNCATAAEEKKSAQNRSTAIIVDALDNFLFSSCINYILSKRNGCTKSSF